MSLFDGLLEPYETPQVAAPEVKQLPPCTVTLKNASNGRLIMLCSVTPPPDHVTADAKNRNLPLFTLDEIPAMRQAAADDPRYIEHLITARLQFGWGGNITFQAAA
jgi:hypothetical protein